MDEFIRSQEGKKTSNDINVHFSENSVNPAIDHDCMNVPHFD